MQTKNKYKELMVAVRAFINAIRKGDYEKAHPLMLVVETWLDEIRWDEQEAKKQEPPENVDKYCVSDYDYRKG